MSPVPNHIFCEPPFLRSTLIVNGPVGMGISLGLRTRCSPSFFSRMSGVVLLVSGRLGMCIVQCDPIRAEEYCAKAQHLEPKSHSFAPRYVRLASRCSSTYSMTARSFARESAPSRLRGGDGR